jgi:S-DNA-T family DNA segregation ATPase FtsK/SpoIIIE
MGKKFKEENFLGLQSETKQGILGILLVTFGLLSILSFLGWAGIVGNYFNLVLGLGFGWLRVIFSIVALVLGYILLRPNKFVLTSMNYFGLILFILSFTAIVHTTYPLELLIIQAKLGTGGGWIGVLFSFPLLKFSSFWAAFIVLIALMLISILILFNTTFEKLAGHSKKLSKILYFILFPFKLLFGLIKNKKAKVVSEESNEEEVEDDDNEEVENKPEKNSKEETESSKEKRKLFFTKKLIKPKNDELISGSLVNLKKQPKIELPIELLVSSTSKPKAGDILNIRAKIAKALQNFGIEVEMGDYNVGPTVTQYTFKPADGVKLTRITALNNDLSLALAAYPLRIEAPIPGQALVGIEVPNKSASTVTIREIIDSESFKKNNSQLTIALGKDVKGKVWVAALDKMPHLLIAGSTGSGKSVCINNIIISLLYQNGPEDLKFIMVDPKRVELKGYDGIPHLITPVITDVKKTVNAFRWCLGEMDRRFELLSKCGHRNISAHNASTEQKLPYIVFVIDELADLMSTCASDAEPAIIRLSQMARAVGIHLILATQRPSVDVITGLIKANITSRIAFSVPSLMDSRTILDTPGAEKLIGRGDMLLINNELSKPARVQGAYISDEEIKKVVQYLKDHGAPEYDDSVVDKKVDDIISSFEGDGDDDELFEEAKETIIRAKKASASLLQRKLKVGYARAARLLDIMEEKGIVGPAKGSKPREILAGEEVLSIEQSYGDDLDDDN